jgi:tRNA 2-thiouridine synthesizing protein A
VQAAYDLTKQAEVMQVDAVGLLCPLPILRLKKRTADLPSATEVEFFTDDPSGRRDLQSLCELVGHELLSIEELANGVICYRLRLA